MLLQDVIEVRNPLRSQTLICKAQTLFLNTIDNSPHIQLRSIRQ